MVVMNVDVVTDMMQMDTVDAGTTGTTARSQLYVQGAG